MSEITPLPRFSQIEHLLTLDELPMNPAYLHGLWCGLVAGGQYCKPNQWIDMALSDDSAWANLDKPVQMLLLQLAEASLSQMTADDFCFELLLPSDDVDLQDRAYALNEWCLGLVLGLENQQGQQVILTGDGAQALADITKISEMDFGIEACEEEEASYVELVEFVRIAVLMIHQNILEETRRTQAPPEQLH